MNLEGKTAVITGGASGLGAATVSNFHERGANIAIFDLNDELGNAVVAELGERALYVNVNVTDEASVAAGIDATLEAFGDIHICCNLSLIHI